MELTKYWPHDIMRVVHAIGGTLAYDANVMRRGKITELKDCANLNIFEALVNPLCESVYLTLKQDLPWGGADPYDSSIALAFCRTDRYYVVNLWYGRPVYIPGSEWEKQGFKMETDCYGAWERIAHCSSDDLIKGLLELETKVNERWREIKRMKINRHLTEIKEVAREYRC